MIPHPKDWMVTLIDRRYLTVTLYPFNWTRCMTWQNFLLTFEFGPLQVFVRREGFYDHS